MVQVRWDFFESQVVILVAMGAADRVKMLPFLLLFGKLLCPAAGKEQSEGRQDTERREQRFQTRNRGAGTTVSCSPMNRRAHKLNLAAAPIRVRYAECMTPSAHVEIGGSGFLTDGTTQVKGSLSHRPWSGRRLG